MPKPFSRAEVDAFFARLKKLDPEPKTELQYVNPYTLLVAVVLSAQATDKGVNKATAPLFKTVKAPEAMVALGEARLADAIKTIGLYRGKAKNVITLSHSAEDRSIFAHGALTAARWGHGKKPGLYSMTDVLGL